MRYSVIVNTNRVANMTSLKSELKKYFSADSHIHKMNPKQQEFFLRRRIQRLAREAFEGCKNDPQTNIAKYKTIIRLAAELFPT